MERYDEYVRPVTLTVQDAERGILEAAWIEFAEGQLAIRRESIFIRRAGPWLLASVPYSAFYLREASPARKTLYTWARVEWVAGGIAISVPQREAFVRYLGGQEQAGQEKDRIALTRVGMDLLTRLQGEAYVWHKPIVFHRLPEPKRYPFAERQ